MPASHTYFLAILGMKSYNLNRMDSAQYNAICSQNNILPYSKIVNYNTHNKYSRRYDFMKVSVSAYSYSQYIRKGLMTQFDCIAKAKEMGFDAIEFTNVTGDTLEEQKENARLLREEADKQGIQIIAYTIGANLFQDTEEKMQAEVERLKDQLDIAKILGAPVLRHDVCYQLGKTGNSRSFDLMLPTIAKNARLVTEYAETLGIKTCTENHGLIAQDSDRVERLFNAVAHDNYGLLVDIGNFSGTGENPALAVSRVAPYAIHVHAKDMNIRTEPAEGFRLNRGGYYSRGCIIGEGKVPVRQCLNILKKAGYDGYVSIEFEGPEDCIEGIAKGKSNLQRFIDDME